MSSQIHWTQRSSVASQNSRCTINVNDHEAYILSDTDLVNLVNDLKKQVNILNLENEILETTILRLDPCLMYGVYHALECATKVQSCISIPMCSFVKSQTSKFGLFESLLSPSRMRVCSRTSSRRWDYTSKHGSHVTMSPGLRINILEKAELVSMELSLMVNRLEKVRQKTAKEHALLEAELEEVEMRFIDIEQTSQSFKQEVLIEGWDKIGQRIPAEIWIRFMTEWVKTTDRTIEKLRLRTSTLKTQYAKLKSQIKDKTELNQCLRPVDFEKIEIQNSECLKLIEQKLNQVQELKKLTGDANLNLSSHKKDLIEQNSYLAKVIEKKENKERKTLKLNKEKELIQINSEELSEKLNKIRKLKAMYEVPDVMDYANVKWEVGDLKRGIKQLETTVHIQQIALASINRKNSKNSNITKL